MKFRDEYIWPNQSQKLQEFHSLQTPKKQGFVLLYILHSQQHPSTKPIILGIRLGHMLQNAQFITNSVYLLNILTLFAKRFRTPGLTEFVSTMLPVRVLSLHLICMHCSFLVCVNSAGTSSIWSMNISSGFVLLFSVCSSNLQKRLND